MDLEKTKLLEQLEQFSGSKFEKLYDGVLDGFAYYFSRMDIDGIDSILPNYHLYDGFSKETYLHFISKKFDYLKSKGINSFEAFSGICNNCIKGCDGFTFIHRKTGLYIDMVVEVKNKTITNFVECYDLKNKENTIVKKERIVIKPF